MSCWACEIADKDPRTGCYQARCHECDARALAQSPAAHDSRKAGALTAPMKTALRRVFGDGWREGLGRVRNWAARIEEATK